MTTKTELEFSYEPLDFFEAPLSLSLKHGQLTVDHGKAVYLLTNPNDPIPCTLRQDVQQEVSNVLKLRQVVANKAFNLALPNATQYQADGRQNRVIQIGMAAEVATAGSLDMLMRDATGRVVHDSRAKRIESDTDFVASVLPKMKNPTLSKMVGSYCAAVADRKNELVHLYEIADAAKKLFDGIDTACSELGISKTEWRALTSLANSGEIRQGRHRGQQTQGNRDATAIELEEARGAAKHIIRAFAAKVQ